jgi:hypothetical protein
MKRIMIAAVGAISLTGSAYAHVDFTDRAETFAAQPEQGYYVIAPAFQPRTVYVVRPAANYRYSRQRGSRADY